MCWVDGRVLDLKHYKTFLKSQALTQMKQDMEGLLLIIRPARPHVAESVSDSKMLD